MKWVYSTTITLMLGGSSFGVALAADEWSRITETSSSQLQVALSDSNKTAKNGMRRPSAKFDGDWTGKINTGHSELRLSLHLERNGDGIVGRLDSIDQNVYAIPIEKITLESPAIVLEVAAVGGVFRGTLTAENGTLEGQWQQGGVTLPLTFTRAILDLARPQTPMKPYPYRVEDVNYNNAEGDLHLAGTLTMPHGAGPFPAVLLISGSGPQDRDETVFGHKPFLVLADYLTRRGFAVLRSDKRGVGSSTGDFAGADLADFVSDNAAWLDYLRSQKKIDSMRVGLIGHSEGGTVASMIAAKDGDIAFVVLLAAPAIRGAELLVEQMRSIAREKGIEEEQIERNAKSELQFFTSIEQEVNSSVFAIKAQVGLSAMKKEMGIPNSALRSQAKMISSNWFRSFLAYDPLSTLNRIKCPILVINGSKDVQVSAVSNLASMRKVLARNPDAKIVEFLGLNHLFQDAKTGFPDEYSQITETISPTLLKFIVEWITA